MIATATRPINGVQHAADVSTDPQTLSQWKQLVESRPESPWLWRPGPEARRLLGLPPTFGRRPRPLGNDWQSRFLASIVQDPQFRTAAVRAFRGQK